VDFFGRSRERPFRTPVRRRGLRIGDCGLEIADWGLRIGDCGLGVVDLGLSGMWSTFQILFPLDKTLSIGDM